MLRGCRLALAWKCQPRRRHHNSGFARSFLTVPPDISKRPPRHESNSIGTVRGSGCRPSGPGWDRPVIVPFGVDQKSLRYCSLPMKPSFVTAERLITASVWSTLSYFACGSGWKCSSGSGLIAAAVSRY
ncbi:hypothetical protein WR25_23457 [Diploscapter pachys]|uniref:Uncharacterized protein n=1 Tax=Diploscapter pachys TaxID=2018661 RepID=A0A2A2KIC0_9BILA|nr:hypothetical protein WR25_23457 [Diploscapter pachys]